MRIVLWLLFVSYAFASNLIELFNKQYYSYICLHRWEFINKYKNDEKLLSLVAYACLKKRYLTPAIDLAKVLRRTPSGRVNSSYITTLFFMKILLERYIKDKYDIQNITLPYLNNSLLSKVFFLTQEQLPKVKDDSFWVKDKKKKYKVVFDEKLNNLFIFIYENDKLLKKERYW